MTMTTSKPYLIRAIYDWIVDNDCTPYIVVNALVIGVQVPQEYVDEAGKIILNISPQACRGLHLDNSRVLFSAKFSGVAHQVCVPPHAIMAIYAKENGRGMVFDDDETDPPPLPPESGVKSADKKKPSLRVVK
jgi:stringent starvation protein B